LTANQSPPSKEF